MSAITPVASSCDAFVHYLNAVSLHSVRLLGISPGIRISLTAGTLT